MVQCAVFAGKEIKDCTRGEACICAKHAVGAGDALTNKCVYGPKNGCISAAQIRPFLEELDRLRAERSAALDLLAVIHRDGGHHTEAVGFIQSCADAIEARTALVLDNDRIRAENERLDHALGVAMQSLARATERAERAEAALAVEKEREGCAKVCEEMIAFDLDDPGKSAAAAIRRRGKP